MKAIIISKNGKIDYKEIKEPKTKKGYVKIKVKAAGLCGSDTQKLFSDRNVLGSVKSRIWGHEISGIVYKVGKNIKEFKIGNRVVVNPLVRNKNEDITKAKSIGKDYPGGFADFVLVPYQNLKKIPSDIKFEEAVLVDSIAAALHGYNLSGSPTKKDILIIGDGSLALITSFLCLEFGNKVTIVGKNDNNLKIASKFGATILKDNEAKNLKQNYDFVFEVVGRKQNRTLRQAIKLIRPCGMIIVLGVFEKGFVGEIPLREFFYKEGKIIGSNSYGFFKGKNEFDIAVDLLKKLKLRFSYIITHTIPLRDFKKGLNLIKNKKDSGAIKIVFRP